jgi:hypothetical protein
VSPLSSIIKYIDAFDSEAVRIDAGLNSLEISQKTAWCSHVETNLGNLAVRSLWLNRKLD